MADQSKNASAKPQGWRRRAQFTLYTHAGWETTAADEIAQGLNGVALPALLLRELQVSVYNALERMAAAHIGCKAIIVLFAPVYPATAAPDECEQNDCLATPQPGWGFFLVERRLGADPAIGPQYMIELYCYQEGS